MSLELRQYEDTLKPSAELETPLSPANRIVYVVQGSVLIGDRDLYEDQAMLTGTEPTAMRAGDLDEAAATKARDEASAALLSSKGANDGEVDYAAVQQSLAEASAQLQLIKKMRRTTGG